MPPDPVGLALPGQALQRRAEASAGPQREVPLHSAGYCTPGSWLPGQAVRGVRGVGGGRKARERGGRLTERKTKGKVSEPEREGKKVQEKGKERMWESVWRGRKAKEERM